MASDNQEGDQADDAKQILTRRRAVEEREAAAKKISKPNRFLDSYAARLGVLVAVSFVVLGGLVLAVIRGGYLEKEDPLEEFRLAGRSLPDTSAKTSDPDRDTIPPAASEIPTDPFDEVPSPEDLAPAIEVPPTGATSPGTVLKAQPYSPPVEPDALPRARPVVP